jgi:hypothetical protein
MRQVWAALLNQGVYLASVSRIYRVLRAAGQVRERRAQARHAAKKKPSWSYEQCTSPPRRRSTTSALQRSNGSVAPNRNAKPHRFTRAPTHPTVVWINRPDDDAALHQTRHREHAT